MIRYKNFSQRKFHPIIHSLPLSEQADPGRYQVCHCYFESAVAEWLILFNWNQVIRDSNLVPKETKLNKPTEMSVEVLKSFLNQNTW